MIKLPEILAPAGSLDCLKAAVAVGADAVYFGGQAFNARRSAANFSIDQIREAVELCHLHGVKTNFTLNTMIRDEEWPELEAYLDQILPLGLDALIIQDLGVAACVARKLKDRYPDVALHGSTQMAVEDLDGVEYLRSLGFSRVVLARELSMEEIRTICSGTDTEVEVFVHGALCYSDSGRCLLSSFHGGRSGNRGACAQPCRLVYDVDGKKGCYINLKDRCADSYLQELIKAGVASLKIEGRMKGEAYVAGVTAYYRNLLDELAGISKRAADKGLEPSRDDLKQLFNRGDFTGGYFDDKKGMIWQGSAKNQGLVIGKVLQAKNNSIHIKTEKELHAGDELEIQDLKKPGNPYSVRLQEDMIHRNRREASFRLAGNIREGQPVRRIVDPKLNDQIREKASIMDPLTVDMEFSAEAGLPMTLIVKTAKELGRETVKIQVKGQVPQLAEKMPFTEEQAEKQLRKCGPEFKARAVIAKLSGDLFIPVAAINSLRRDALQALRDKILKIDQDKEQIRLRRELQKKLYAPSVIDASSSVSSENGYIQKISYQLAVENMEQWNALRNGDFRDVSAVIFSMEGMSGLTLGERADLLDQVHELNGLIRAAVRLPRVGRLIHKEWILAEMDKWKQAGVTIFEASRMGQIQLIKDQGMTVWAGPDMGVMNETAADFMRSQCENYFVSRELSLYEMKHLVTDKQASAVIYGRVPYMITEQCIYKERYGCRPCKEGHVTTLTDRQGEAMKAVSHCPLCYMELYSEKPVYAENWQKELSGSKGTLRLEFTTENDLQSINAWEEVRMGSLKKDTYMSGHFEKGVE